MSRFRFPLTSTVLGVFSSEFSWLFRFWLRAADDALRRLRVAVVGVFIEGLLFAHMLELVHSCIHGTAFGSRRVDRIVGVLLGLPMLVSFSDYRDNHLEHHRKLGKSEKKDFFGYEFDNMTTWLCSPFTC